MRNQGVLSFGLHVLLISALNLYVSSPLLAFQGDITGDGNVDFNDVGVLSLNWLGSDCNVAGWCGGADIDHSNDVSFIDFALLANNWMQTEPTPPPDGLEGYEPLATGGQGGTVVHVTNLADSGAGSFRAAVAALNGSPTIIVFDVSGVICTTSEIKITRPNVTIDGSTAPGEGITFTNNGGFFDILGIELSGDANVIVKHLRFRNSGKEGIQLWDGGKITINHCSVTGSLDGALDMNTVNHVLVSRCLFGGNVEGHKAHGTYVTAHHSLYTWNERRTPRVFGGGPYWDFRNNVVDLWNGTGTNIIDSNNVNVINNWYGDPAPGMVCESGFWSINTSNYVYVHGNYSHCGQDVDAMGNTSIPNIEPNVTTTSASRVYANVLANCGAQPTDAIDQYYINGGGLNPPAIAACGGSSSGGGGSGSGTHLSVDAKDGWVKESTETSGIGGTYGTTATYLGDTASNQQYIGVLHFDTSAIPDGATITSAKLTIKRFSVVGSPTSLGSITVDIKNGFYGATDALRAEDFESASSATNVATLTPYPASNGATSSGNLNAAGLAQINKTGVTQFKIRFTLDDDNDGADDYLSIYDATNNPSLEVAWQ